MVSLLILLKHHFIPKMYKQWLFKYFKIAFRKRHREDGLRIFHRAAEEKKRGTGNGVTGRDCNLKIVPSSFWPWPKKWTTRNRPVNFVLFFLFWRVSATDAGLETPRCVFLNELFERIRRLVTVDGKMVILRAFAAVRILYVEFIEYDKKLRFRWEKFALKTNITILWKFLNSDRLPSLLNEWF